MNSSEHNHHHGHFGPSAATTLSSVLAENMPLGGTGDIGNAATHHAAHHEHSPTPPIHHEGHHEHHNTVSPATAIPGREGAELSLHDHQHGSGPHDGHQMKMWFHGGCSEVILFDFWRIDSWTGLFFSCILIFVMAAAYEGLKWFRVRFQLWANARQRLAVVEGNGANHNCAPKLPTISLSFKGLSKHAAAEEALIQPSPTTGESDRKRLNHETSEDQDPHQQPVYVPTVAIEAGQSVSQAGRKAPSLRHLREAVSFAVSQLARSPCASRWIESCLYCVQLMLAYWLMLIAMTYNVHLTAMVVLGAGFGHWLFAFFDCKFPMPKRDPNNSHAGSNGNSQAMRTAIDRADDFASDACH